MKVLIIGGCGYTGSAIYNYLAEKKYTVASVDLELFGNPGITNSKTNFNELDDSFLSIYNVVVLLAGHSSVKMCENNMLGCFKNNVSNFVSLLPKIKSEQKLIYASSSSVYGNVNRNIVNEECREYVAGSFYDLTKVEIDNYAELYNKLNFYGLRFGTVNGYSPNLRNDIMINAMVCSALKKGEIKIYNPMVKRPILDVKDLCRAIEIIIEKGTADNKGIYNLASFNSTVDIIGRKVGKILDVPANVYETPPPIEEDINKKLVSKVYDFAISSDKFTKYFDFNFKGTVESIAQDLKNNIDSCRLVDNRNIEDIIL